MKKTKRYLVKHERLTDVQIKKVLALELTGLRQTLTQYFTRPETQTSAMAYIKGLLSLVSRKNSWQLAEQLGYENPYALQYLLGRAKWDADALRDEIRDYSIHYLDDGQSILSVDETGFLKKGKKSVGVARQYSGTAGRIENCQVGVFLSYSSTRGRTLIDRDLYIPQAWFEDKGRCKEAGIPEEITFKTKPELAKHLLHRAFEHGVKATWVVGDEVYGCFTLRRWLESQQQPYVLAVASNYYVAHGLQQHKVSDLLKSVSKNTWKKCSVGKGTKGERYYYWHRIQLNSDSPAGWHRWLVFRRSIKDSQSVAFYIAYSPDTASLKAMACAAGSRWTIEECFEMAKGDVGLDDYEVRSWVGWYRHITLALLALSCLTKLRYQLNQAELRLQKKRPTSASDIQKMSTKSRVNLIVYSVQETRTLLIHFKLLLQKSIAYLLHWSYWRRKHQTIAKCCHYQKRRTGFYELQL